MVLALVVTSAGVATSAPVIRSVFFPAAPRVVTPATSTPPQGPTEQDVSAEHNVYDSDLAKKFVLYHELAAQLDQHTLDVAVEPAVREFAAQQYRYNNEQVALYSALLRSLNESFPRLEDYPKIPGSSCGTYPTFPGMLPHGDVTAFLETTADTVGAPYLRLITQQRNDILTTISANEEFANYKQLSDIRKEFLAARRDSLRQLQQLQQQN